MIKKLKVKNFKNLKYFKCKFCALVSMLTGQNMFGKSNFIDVYMT